ncbi:unnamed protein product [Symbiodinium pilosum]|uniref:Uncharacterized protein n=1 Tax=Symbiodinium pilosum TaxID=2952 RepID=A0A812QMU0_SYMPI|nr:unnamed protein product [Symbiodinium pilosum]
MPKTKVMKALKSKAPFPDAKRGKHRVQRRPAAKAYIPVPYVRHGIPSSKNRAHRVRWGLSVQKLMSMNGRRLINLLQKDHILPHWQGRSCPRCGNGTLGELRHVKGKNVWAYRCNHFKCHKHVQPHDFHPIFFMGAGSSITSLNHQAAALYCAVASVPGQSTHLLLDTGDKPVERIYANLDVARASYDVEVDEVDIGKNKQRSPGPGPIRKRDWSAIGNRHLANRKVILHSDGARAYKLKLPQVMHCNVVHQKKKAKINGKALDF